MPGLITHNIVANKVIDKIGVECKESFLLGALGPDVCYFHRAMPWQIGSLRAYGKKMHHFDPNKLFRYMNGLLLENDDKTVKSYVEGFLCHYALDSTVHPYVYFSIPKYKNDMQIKYNDGFIHNLIEYKTDSLILMQLYGKKVKEYDLHNVIPTDEKAVDAAAYVLCKSVNTLFAESPVDKSQFVQAYGDLFSNTSALQKSGRVKKGAVSLLERLFHIGPALSPLFWGEPDYSYDYMNMAHNEWFNLNAPEKKLTFSYIDLADRAAEYTCELVLNMRNALDRGVLAEYSLNNLFVNGKKILGDKNENDKELSR